MYDPEVLTIRALALSISDPRFRGMSPGTLLGRRGVAIGFWALYSHPNCGQKPITCCRTNASTRPRRRDEILDEFRSRNRHSQALVSAPPGDRGERVAFRDS